MPPDPACECQVSPPCSSAHPSSTHPDPSVFLDLPLFTLLPEGPSAFPPAGPSPQRPTPGTPKPSEQQAVSDQRWQGEVRRERRHVGAPNPPAQLWSPLLRPCLLPLHAEASGALISSYSSELPPPVNSVQTSDLHPAPTFPRNLSVELVSPPSRPLGIIRAQETPSTFVLSLPWPPFRSWLADFGLLQGGCALPYSPHATPRSHA